MLKCKRWRTIRPLTRATAGFTLQGPATKQLKSSKMTVPIAYWTRTNQCIIQTLSKTKVTHAGIIIHTSNYTVMHDDSKSLRLDDAHHEVQGRHCISIALLRVYTSTTHQTKSTHNSPRINLLDIPTNCFGTSREIHLQTQLQTFTKSK